MKSVGESVKIGEAGWNTREFAPALPRRIDFVHRGRDEGREWLVILMRPPLSGRVNLGLCGVNEFFDVAAIGGVSELHDASAGVNEAAQNRPLAHDSAVESRVRGGGHRGDQRVKIGRAPDAGEFTPLVQDRKSTR